MTCLSLSEQLGVSAVSLLAAILVVLIVCMVLSIKGAKTVWSRVDFATNPERLGWVIEAVAAGLTQGVGGAVAAVTCQTPRVLR